MYVYITAGGQVKQTQVDDDSRAFAVSSALRVEAGGVPKVFSGQTLREFEDASASIPLRQINRAFDAAHIRLGADPSELGGARRTQFRRYVAGVDQRDPEQRDRLADALGALIAEVAASKQDFLVRAAERDGFSFAQNVFRPAETAPSSFTVSRAEDFAFIDDRARRLHVLAADSPGDAVAAAGELVDSVCRTVLRLIGEPGPAKTAGLVATVTSLAKALDGVPQGTGDAKRGAVVVGTCLQQLGNVVARCAELRNLYGSDRSNGTSRGLSPLHARLAVGAAVTLAAFIAETYVERAALKKA